MSKSIYAIVTEQIIEKIAGGCVVPWRRPWGNRAPIAPANLATKRPYRGINVLRLLSAGKASAWWASKTHIEHMGGKILAGTESTPVIGYFVTSDGEFRIVKYDIYNLDDVEGIEGPVSRVELPITRIRRCDNFLRNMPQGMPIVEHGSRKARYYHWRDLVRMPDPNTFDDMEAYYATLLHEYAHATGHQRRLGRMDALYYLPYIKSGEQWYAAEEVVAEMTSAFVCGQLRINQKRIGMSARYIKTFGEVLVHEPYALLKMANMAQKAADYLNGRKVEKDTIIKKSGIPPRGVDEEIMQVC